MILQKLIDNNLIHPPKWLRNNVHYLAICGSESYGMKTTSSDCDLVGFCMPPKTVLFPEKYGGEIFGFDLDSKRFEQFQAHHIEYTGKEYDITVYNLVKYFKLLLDGNPSLIDSIFVDQQFVVHTTQIGNLVRENRHLFLSKKLKHRYAGYAYSQLAKMSKGDKVNGARLELIKKYGYDVKFAAHTIRLLLECEQLLLTKDLDLRANAELLKKIRRGEYSEQEIRQMAAEKEKVIDALYISSSLPDCPRQVEAKQLLLKCIHMHYQDIDIPMEESEAIKKLKQIKEILE